MSPALKFVIYIKWNNPLSSNVEAFLLLICKLISVNVKVSTSVAPWEQMRTIQRQLTKSVLINLQSF
jgi:hypothetical protein